jgi:hypothetical protein
MLKALQHFKRVVPLEICIGIWWLQCQRTYTPLVHTLHSDRFRVTVVTRDLGWNPASSSELGCREGEEL